MGLFDKKKKGSGEDDYDSPVEQVNLRSAPPAATARPAGQTAVPQASSLATAPAAPTPGASPAAAAPAPAPAPAPRPAPAPPPPEYDAPEYGIEKAIELMRLLPADNVQLVVQVVKKTLESLGVQVGTIIKDATRKQGDIEGRVDVLKREIAELEGEISTRKSEITRLEADHMETSSVKERLVLAEKLTNESKAAAASPGAPAAPRPSGSFPAAGAAAPKPTNPPPTGPAPSTGSTIPPASGEPKK